MHDQIEFASELTKRLMSSVFNLLLLDFFPRFFAFREANQLSEEMSKETEFAVTLQVQFRNVFMRKLMQAVSSSIGISILGDPGADKGGEGKNIYGTKKSKVFGPHFSARLDFPSSPLSAPGSPRMRHIVYKRDFMAT